MGSDFDEPDVGTASVRLKVLVWKETIMIKWLFRISVSIGLAGMVGGMLMGMAQNFLLAPAHAHFILLGFIVMFLSALYYRTVPEAAASKLAPVQAVISVAGAFLFPIGMLRFVVIVYRSSGRAPARATARNVERPSPAAETVQEFVFTSTVRK